MRQHKTDGQAEGVCRPFRPLEHAETVEIVDRRRGDVLVVHLVGALSGTRPCQTDPFRAGGAGQHAMIDAPTTNVVRTVVANRPVHVAVKLVRPYGVHPSD